MDFKYFFAFIIAMLSLISLGTSSYLRGYSANTEARHINNAVEIPLKFENSSTNPKMVQNKTVLEIQLDQDEFLESAKTIMSDMHANESSKTMVSYDKDGYEGKSIENQALSAQLKDEDAPVETNENLTQKVMEEKIIRTLTELADKLDEETPATSRHKRNTHEKTLQKLPTTKYVNGVKMQRILTLHGYAEKSFRKMMKRIRKVGIQDCESVLHAIHEFYPEWLPDYSLNPKEASKRDGLFSKRYLDDMKVSRRLEYLIAVLKKCSETLDYNDRFFESDDIYKHFILTLENLQHVAIKNELRAEKNVDKIFESGFADGHGFKNQKSLKEYKWVKAQEEEKKE